MSVAEVERLRAENEELRERVRQLEEVIGFKAPRRFLGLRPLDSKVLMLLTRLEIASVETVMAALYGNRPNEVPDSNLLSVVVHRLRRILAPHGIKIGTVWGVGYTMTRESKAIVAKMMEKENAKADLTEA